MLYITYQIITLKRLYRGKLMKQILFSEKNTVKFDLDYVEINEKKLQKDDLDSSTTESYAISKMRDFYSSLIAKQYENLVVLSGSGTSVGIGIEDNKGKTMHGLWKSVIDTLSKEKLENFCTTIKYDDFKEEDSDLEAILSRALLAQSYLDDKDIYQTIEDIQTIIRKECALTLPDDSPHEAFLKKATSRKLKYSRLKIFTLNYDLLFEQAASKNGYVVIDGFSFSYPRRFNGVNYDYDIVLRNNSRIVNEENYATSVFQLYKPHGSLDWEKRKLGTEEYILKTPETKQPLMIYPNRNKYESSYEQPYFEMMSRFQQELRKQNTFLIVIGFSFYDMHIKAMIYEALNVNPSINLLMVSPDVEKENSFLDLKRKAMHNGSIYLVSETFSDFAKHYPYSRIYDFSTQEINKNE